MLCMLSGEVGQLDNAKTNHQQWLCKGSWRWRWREIMPLTPHLWLTFLSLCLSQCLSIAYITAQSLRTTVLYLKDFPAERKSLSSS